MKLIILTAIVTALTCASADAVADAEAWANADSLCYQNCGRAMTEFNKCKGQGANKHNCICADNSRFHQFYDQCVQCPDYIVNKFSALSIPEAECGISRKVDNTDFTTTVPSISIVFILVDRAERIDIHFIINAIFSTVWVSAIFVSVPPTEPGVRSSTLLDSWLEIDLARQLCILVTEPSEHSLCESSDQGISVDLDK
ncbi:hypothetical protein TRICI_005639 [Trichomonascus ciferrii]|uniref:Extracellular membrane protein CFEM domain-containing protein n=1 Tax=Trichomonascus ciferrii TaxID=44093 RepID=A0A642URA7_9ASCO|nr:hypothetical protein TRICI_005639 [Trichomonascus ciferrii]